MLIMLFLCAKAAGKAGRVYNAAACLPVWRRLRSQAALLCWPCSMPAACGAACCKCADVQQSDSDRAGYAPQQRRKCAADARGLSPASGVPPGRPGPAP
jgi:hypothetical protein